MVAPSRNQIVAFVREARACLKDGRLEDAEAIANEILASATDPVQALDIIVRVRLAQRNPSDALELVEQALKVAPDHPSMVALRQRAQALLDRQMQIDAQHGAMLAASAEITKGHFDAAAEILVAASLSPDPAPSRQFLALLAESGRVDWALHHLKHRSLMDETERSLLAADLHYAAGEVETAMSIVSCLAEADPLSVGALKRGMMWSRTVGQFEAAADWATLLGKALQGAEFLNLALQMANLLDLVERRELAGEVKKRGRLIAESAAAGSGAGPAFGLCMYDFDLSAAEDVALRLSRDQAECNDLLARLEVLRRNAAYMEVHRLVNEKWTGGDADLTFYLRGSINDGLSKTRPLVELEAARSMFGTALRMARNAGLRVRAVRGTKGFRLPSDVADKPSVLSFHTIGGKDAVHAKMGGLTGTMLLDRGGYSGWSTLADRPLSDLPLQGIAIEEAVLWMEAERRARACTNASKYAQTERSAVNFTRPAVLVALQIPYDSVMQHARIDPFALLPTVVERFAGTGTKVIVKRHPHCSDPRVAAQIRQMLRQPHVRLSTASIHDLFDVVQAVYVVNSGVGAEALLYGMAVHVCGKTDYRHVCHEIRSVQDILDCRDPITPPLPAAEIARYMWWYVNVYHVSLEQPGALEAALDRMLIQPALRRRMGR